MRYILIIALLLITIFNRSSLFALSDKEYEDFKSSSPEFKQADDALSQVWHNLLKIIPQKDKHNIIKDQNRWISHARDNTAIQYMQNDKNISVAQAYAKATIDRKHMLEEKLNEYNQQVSNNSNKDDTSYIPDNNYSEELTSEYNSNFTPEQDNITFLSSTNWKCGAKVGYGIPMNVDMNFNFETGIATASTNMLAHIAQKIVFDVVRNAGNVVVLNYFENKPGTLIITIVNNNTIELNDTGAVATLTCKRAR